MPFKGLQGFDWGSGYQKNFEALELFAFPGKNGAGAITATGLKVGDLIISVTGLAAAQAGDQSAAFESVVSVADQIQQSSSSNLSANAYIALVLRKS